MPEQDKNQLSPTHLTPQVNEAPNFIEGAVRHEYSDSRIMNIGRHALSKLRGDTEYAPFPVTDPVSGTEKQIDLITPEHFEKLPDGAVLIRALDGRQVAKGQDSIDLDTRRGMIYFGLPTQTPRDRPYTGPPRSH